MDFLKYIIYIIGVLICLSIQDDTQSERVIDKTGSDQKHYEGDEHNPEFDHDSFLGKDQAKEFDNLPIEESMRRLGLIFDKIDVDNNGQLTEQELKDWIVNVQNRYVNEDTLKQWKSSEYGDEGSSLKWTDYVTKHYDETDQVEDIKNIVARDERRWKLADINRDGDLNLKEMASFLHPEETVHMQDNVVLETLEDMDKNVDGKIDIDEFINDMWTKTDENESPPEWVDTEKESFTNSLDKNKDGFMDSEELKSWVLPSDFDHSESEAKHLIENADNNQDGLLSKEEVLDNHNIFAGNHVTDYGDLLKHSEL